MASQQRLPAPYGLLIDRGKPCSFEFDGKGYIGYGGDTIASALIANQQWLMSRSFKYHRMRGPLTMAGHDANTLVQLKSAPNTLADKQLLQDGMQVHAQNVAGSLRRDWLSVLGSFAKFLPVGFYYKAFFRPRGIWPLWAKLIRRQAGLGVIDQSYSTAHNDEEFDKQYKFANVVVVGGGPAGLSAALAAAKAEEEVLLVDENKILGGSFNYLGAGYQVERDSLVAEVLANPKIEVLCNTICNSWQADHWLALVNDTRLHKVRAKRVVLATGSIEQPAIFRGNDLPGVVVSSAVLRLLNLYAVKPGDKAVVLAGNDEGYGTAQALHAAGVEVVAIVDLRDASNQPTIAQELEAVGVPIFSKSTIFEAQLDKTAQRVGKVEVRKITEPGKCAETGRFLECDFVCVAVGYMPSWQLPCMAGAQLSYDDASAEFALSKLPAGMRLAGSVNGAWQLDDVIAQGRAAGENRSAGPPESVPLNHPWPIFAHPKGKEFVDFDEDLQIADIINATRDGYSDIQLVKRYSTCGMGPSQGRHSALAAARLVADVTGRSVAETGVTTARPPVAAETLAVNAGRSFYPARRTNMHYRHAEAGAQMMQAGAWYRPAYYGPQDRAQQCIHNEVMAVRNSVGLIDVSTLGGLEVRGPDAGEFLNRFYTFTFTKLVPGQARYALLCNEAGVVIDDGVAARLHEQHFYVTATTGGVDRVFQSMLKWNAQWGLDVDIANATTAWCGVNIAGPDARKVLAKVCDSLDLSADAFPYMAVREAKVAGIPARLLRVGFVGELGYEIHVPQLYGEALWDSLLKAGEEFSIKPFGVEAQRVLRLEKGHVIIGQDTDAMSNPMELQMNWALARKKPFFVGARTLRELETKPLERVLAGFTLPIGAAQPKESCLVLEGEQMAGRVTSCAVSPTLNKQVGLAYVPPSAVEPGSVITIKCEGGERVDATIQALPFYDAEGARQAV